nr:hypothetical protein [uncultured Pseudodesulfovibrio sp.]
MNIEDKWLRLNEDRSIIEEVIASFPIDPEAKGSDLRMSVMNAALEWARKAHPDDVSAAMHPLSGGAKSDLMISELEKREDFRGYQKWWFNNQDDKPLSVELYMDWIEALMLLWERLEE